MLKCARKYQVLLLCNLSFITHSTETFISAEVPDPDMETKNRR